MTLIFIVAFWSLAALLIGRTYLRIRQGRGYEQLVSAIAASLYVIALAMPATMQVAGLLRTKLTVAQVLVPLTWSELGSLSAAWSLELAVIAVVEQAAWAVRQDLRPGAHCAESGQGAKTTSRAAIMLVTMGAAGVILAPPELDERGQGGNGIVVLLQGSLLVGTMLLVYYRHFGRRSFLVITMVTVTYLIASGVRSPLVLLVFALLARQLGNRVGRKGRFRLYFWIPAAAGAAIVGSFMSAYRGNITRNLGLSWQELLSFTLQRPLVAPYEAGIDTLDGYRFSPRVAPLIDASPLDFMKVVTTFVPSSIWPDKPQALTVEVASRFLGYEGSGMYLSAVGYLRIIGGSYASAIALLAILAFILSLLMRRYESSPYECLVMLAAFRFFLGGDQFDFYYVLVLAIPLWITLGVVRKSITRRGPSGQQYSSERYYPAKKRLT